MTNTADDTGYNAHDDEVLYREYAEDADVDPYDEPDYGWDDPAEYGDYEPNPYDGTYSEM